MIEIVDASVAVKWFVRDHETGLDSADDVLQRVVLNPMNFAVPSLFHYEVHAVLCRRLKHTEDVDSHMEILWALAIPTVEADSETLRQATQIATAMGLSAYDAVYLSLAKILRGTWLTCDKKAHERARRSKLSRLVA